MSEFAEYNAPFVRDKDITVIDGDLIPEDVPDHFADRNAINEKIIDAATEIVKLQETIKKFNKSKNEIYERMESQGIPKQSLKDTIRVLSLTAEQRLIYDSGTMIARQACGVPVQSDLFNHET